MSEPLIIGAGLAGLIAACHFKNSTVVEAGPELQQHKALLRFRSDIVSRITGIPFKAVQVHKAVYDSGVLHQGTCPIDLANKYSRKVTGGYRSRSIMNLDTVTRYVAPDDFYEQLIDKVGRSRICFDTPLLNVDKRHKYISTMPLPKMMDICGLDKSSIGFNFDKKDIRVTRLKLNIPLDLYQTVYFPQKDLSVYRVSITGDTIIIESLWGNVIQPAISLILRDAFGIDRDDVEWSSMEHVDQKYGKIVDIPSELRHSILYQLTQEFNVYSLGRFATWRNVLLDDVAEDVSAVETLIKASSYQQSRILSKKV